MHSVRMCSNKHGRAAFLLPQLLLCHAFATNGAHSHVLYSVWRLRMSDTGTRCSACNGESDSDVWACDRMACHPVPSRKVMHEAEAEAERCTSFTSVY